MPRPRPIKARALGIAPRNERATSSGLEPLLDDLRTQKREIEGKNRSLEQARANLSATLEHYADLFDNAPVAYLSLDPNGVVTEANLTASRLLGVGRERLVGKPLVGLIETKDRPRFLAHMRQCRRAGGAHTELRLASESAGGPIELESRRSKGAGEEATYRTAMIGLEERRRGEAARAEAERERHLAEQREQAARAATEAKDRFIAELSHELRTPLTPILAAVTGLAGRSDVPEFLRPTIAMIRRNVEIEARLIDDLLDLSRIEQKRIHLELAVCDAHELIADAATLLDGEARYAAVELEIRLQARERYVRADPLRLRQIFWNLLSNAIRNTPHGGKTEISTSNIGPDLRIAVRDSGVGIDPSRLEEIFTPFSRDDATAAGSKGLGLGLAIVKGLVEAHAGRVVALSSGKGEGATFVVDFPTVEAVAAAPSPAKSAPVAEPSSAPRQKRRILLVEDHADTRAALRAFLELKGYDVRVAADVASAVELARDEPDLVVCDIGLPDGTGFDVMRRISAADRRMKAIALTGYGSPHDVELAQQAGFAMHLTKPIDVAALLDAIEKLCNAA